MTDRSVFVALPLDGVIIVFFLSRLWGICIVNVSIVSGFSPPFVWAAFMLFFLGSLFSMDGDFAPMVELARLRKKHGFLLVIDDVSIESLFSRGIWEISK